MELKLRRIPDTASNELKRQLESIGIRFRSPIILILPKGWYKKPTEQFEYTSYTNGKNTIIIHDKISCSMPIEYDYYDLMLA